MSKSNQGKISILIQTQELSLRAKRSNPKSEIAAAPSVPGNDKIFNAFVLISALTMVCCASLLYAAEEKLTITTYFPKPYASYKELTTTGDTYLDTASSGNVGIGTIAPVGLLQVGASPAPGLFVASSGSVGMGTTNPSGYKLYVNGDLYVNGLLKHPSPTSPPPAAGAGKCPTTACTIYRICKDSSCSGGNFCNIIILDGIITDSNC